MPEVNLNMTTETDILLINTDNPWKEPAADSPVFAFFKNALLLNKKDFSLPVYEEISDYLNPSCPIAYNGILNQKDSFAAAALSENNNLQAYGLRELISIERENFFFAAGRASQLVSWIKHNKYCGVCGSLTAPALHERAFKCTSCENLIYPRISPAIITAVVKDDKILMARSTRSVYTNYSVLAGFVEAGESLEDAVHREVFEECGIKIKNLKYITSQPWPFPHTLMCGFIAEWKEGEINIDPTEILTADWFSRTELPKLPLSLSISRKLIDIFINNC